MDHFARASGILLHLTSLPGRFGVGDLGVEAYRFIDFLVEAKQSLWQILPLGPTSKGNLHSPYMALSAFAGNPLLISLEMLAADGLLPESALGDIAELPQGITDYDQAGVTRMRVLRLAAERFAREASDSWRQAFSEFCNQQHWWLEDYALFMSLRTAFHETLWTTWEPELRSRAPSAVQEWTGKLAAEIHFHKLLQFFFVTQWTRVKAHANRHGVRIVGDIPIYVGFDSAEVWAHPELFDLQPETWTPRFVAGVPPDYFSETGQRWGNPLYRWHDKHGHPLQAVYDWWVQRFRATLSLVDIVRVDHFRGLESYWAIPAEEPTAVNGHWELGPGRRLFTQAQSALGSLPIIAEDLGIITPEVDALRLQFHFPGMKVLQFAFGGDAANPYLPHNYTDPRFVVYTGTHDNDTTLGWFHSSSSEDQAKILRYLGCTQSEEIHWALIRLAWSSVATLAITPLQDVLGFGSEGRMNIPAEAQGNWGWRYQPDALVADHSGRLAELTRIYGREVTPGREKR